MRQGLLAYDDLKLTSTYGFAPLQLIEELDYIKQLCLISLVGTDVMHQVTTLREHWPSWFAHHFLCENWLRSWVRNPWSWTTLSKSAPKNLCLNWSWWSEASLHTSLHARRIKGQLTQHTISWVGEWRGISEVVIHNHKDPIVTLLMGKPTIKSLQKLFHGR